MKRILVTGDSDWVDIRAIRDALIKHGPTEIVHGGCRTGADKIASDLVMAWGWPEETHVARWEKNGGKAASMRDALMVRSGADLALVFGTASKSTQDCMAHIQRAGMVMHVHSQEWPACSDGDEWRHLYEERAAVMEHDGGLSRSDAEAAAREILESAYRGQQDREKWVE